MSISNFTDFNLPNTAYANFDALSLKNEIINRLNQSEVFHDQAFESSNLNAVIDVVAYMYHVLLFYLNTTSSESTFTTAELYESVNKLVSNLGYKPTGKQTSLVTLSLSGTSSLTPNNYTLKRFSTLNVNGYGYSNIQDITFEKTTTGNESLTLGNNVLYQGTVKEYTPYTAQGENFEVVTLADSSTIDNSTEFVADNSFSIFVRDYNLGTWSEWDETSSLFLESSTSQKYEKRLNENGYYEFKFGNGVNGKSLKQGDIVQIYYLRSNGSQAELGANVLNGSIFKLYNTPTFQSISNDIYSNLNNTTIIGPNQLQYLTPNNDNNSTPVVDAESVDEIKQNAPKVFSSQNRLVTATDYINFLNSKFNNIVKSITVLDNTEYLNSFVKYFYNIGLTRPNEDTRVLFNQLAFSNSTSFNNVYVFSVPKASTILNEQIPNFLNFTQKEFIINQCSEKKDITHNVVCMDPVYKAFDIGLKQPVESSCVDLRENSYLIIKKSTSTKISNDTLKQQVLQVIRNYFDGLGLGSNVSPGTLGSNILSLPGVSNISTRRTDIGLEIPGISFVIWNPSYDTDDVDFTNQDFPLQKFMFGYFYELSNLRNRIIVENE